MPGGAPSNGGLPWQPKTSNWPPRANAGRFSHLSDTVRHSLPGRCTAGGRAVGVKQHRKGDRDTSHPIARQYRDLGHQGCIAPTPILPDTGAEIDMAEVRIRAERRIGRFMAMQREDRPLAPTGRHSPPGGIAASARSYAFMTADPGDKNAGMSEASTNSTPRDLSRAVTAHNVTAHDSEETDCRANAAIPVQ
jgi:hypothetical protein